MQISLSVGPNDATFGCACQRLLQVVYRLIDLLLLDLYLDSELNDAKIGFAKSVFPNFLTQCYISNENFCAQTIDVAHYQTMSLSLYQYEQHPEPPIMIVLMSKDARYTFYTLSLLMNHSIYLTI